MYDPTDPREAVKLNDLRRLWGWPPRRGPVRPRPDVHSRPTPLAPEPGPERDVPSYALFREARRRAATGEA